MIVRDKNLKCSFCNQNRARAATYDAQGKIIGICGGCAIRVFPELMAESFFVHPKTK